MGLFFGYLLITITLLSFSMSQGRMTITDIYYCWTGSQIRVEGSFKYHSLNHHSRALSSSKFSSNLQRN